MGTHRRKTTKLKHRKRPTAAGGRGSSAAADLQTQLDQRTRELAEALEQQTATSEVLRVISASSGDLQPVFQAMLENAVRICEAKYGNLFLIEAGDCRWAAGVGTPPKLVEYYTRSAAFRPTPGSHLDRVARTKQVSHTADDTGEAVIGASARLGGARSTVCVPMLKDDALVGAIFIYRTEVRPFTDKQIALVENFANQAVIAIENTRLLNELRQRTADLSESLEQQTATSEVLRVISSSPGELEPVFDAMLESATRICEAKFGTLYLADGDTFRAVAIHNAPQAYTEERKGRSVKPGPLTALGRVARTKQLAQIVDIMMDQPYLERDPYTVAAVELGGFRTVISIPMLRETELVGAIQIYRQEVRPFTDKQIDLVKNFAAQAVIAIENARLLNELRQRTADLGEALEQQTATSEVLKVISSSPGDLAPVFSAMLANATRLCEASYGLMYLCEGDALRMAALHGDLPGAFKEQWRFGTLFRPHPDVAPARAVRTRKVVHVADLREDQAYLSGDPLPVAGVEVAGIRTLVVIPMLKENKAVGAISIYRKEVRSFTDKQIELVTNFAAQAVIAIENTRLLNELRESLQQQTATADVLKIISRSTFNLQTVLDTLIASAATLCEADQGYIGRPKGDGFFRAEGLYGYSSAFKDILERTRWKAGRESAIGRVLLERAAIHILDVEADPEYRMVEIQKIGGYRSILGVPLLREGTLIGVLVLARCSVRPFTDKQIELVTTFADQAVIAIENVRLFDEIQDKSRQLEEASKHKSQFLANMSHELRTPLNAVLGYTELILDSVYGEMPEKARSVLDRVQRNGRHLLGLINDVLDLSKIEAGQFTLSLSDYSLKSVIQTVFSAIEPLAKEKQLALKIDVTPELPQGRGDERRLTQVLLNLVGNAIKFTDSGEISIKGSSANGSFTVAVRDTGPGISETDQAKLFQEFQQADNSITRKKGGTGLGLAISKRIIEMHGGKIWLESVVGQGSTFAFTLPVKVEQQAKPT